MTIKLYHSPMTRSFTSLWMLEETGAPYEIVRQNIRAPGHPDAAYLAINPMGKVPALVDGGVGFGETAAILLYLADRYASGRLAPALNDAKRGRFLQWQFWPQVAGEPAMMEKRNGTPTMPTSAGWGDYDRAFGVLEKAMTPGQWLLGGDFTSADLGVASLLSFGMNFGMIDKRPAFTEFADRARARPAFKRASDIEAKEAGKP